MATGQSTTISVGGECECGCGFPVKTKGSLYRRGHNLNASRPPEERFWANLDATGSCWEWRGESIRLGYGRLRVGRRKVLAHRFAYAMFRGEPGDLFVCHTCDNPPCCNPTHLFLGTTTDNMRDMVSKGRNAESHGEHNPNAKLTDDDAREVIRMRAAGASRRVVAERFGISRTMVSLITSGRNWKCLAKPA